MSAESGGNGLCGEGREDLLGAGGRGQHPMKERPRRPCPDLPLSPVPACPSLASRPLFSSLSGVRAGLRLLPSPWTYAPFSFPGSSPLTRDPRREKVGPSLTLPAPRLPLPEVFRHRRVPARPRGAPLYHRRLRGRHAVRAVRQRHPGSEDGAAGAVGGAGGARVLGSEHAENQGLRTDFPSEPEQPARLLQPERGR